MEAAAKHCLRKLQDFNPQNVANVAWAYAKLGHLNKELMEAFEGEVGLHKFRNPSQGFLVVAPT